MSHYDTNLDKNRANYVPLTPLSFLERAKEVYPNYEAIVYEDRKYTWSDVYKRATKFASALEKIGISKGDTVSFLAFNTPEIFEAHYSVPMTGAVLNTINSRVDAKTVAYILEHSEAKVLIVDRQLHSIIDKALSQIKPKPIIIDIQDNFADQSLLKKIGEKEYEDFINVFKAFGSSRDHCPESNFSLECKREKPCWWDNMIGPNKPIDTDKLYVVCLNNLGGCHGSTGPTSLNPKTKKIYGSDFPIMTVSDWVNSQKELMSYLGIPSWRFIVGGSLGGMQAFQWTI